MTKPNTQKFIQDWEVLDESQFITFNVHYGVFPKKAAPKGSISYHDTEERAILVKNAVEHYMRYCNENNINPLTNEKNPPSKQPDRNPAK